jgi:hypothetical protein
MAKGRRVGRQSGVDIQIPAVLRPFGACGLRAGKIEFLQCEFEFALVRRFCGLETEHQQTAGGGDKNGRHQTAQIELSFHVDFNFRIKLRGLGIFFYV